MRSSVGLTNPLGRCFDVVRQKNLHNPSFQSCSYSQNALASVPSFPNLAALFAATPCVPKTYMGELIRIRKQVLDCEPADTVASSSCHCDFFVPRRKPAPHKLVFWHTEVSTNSKPEDDCHTVRNTISPHPRHLRKKTYSHTKRSKIST